jgi:hypothetical protein
MLAKLSAAALVVAALAVSSRAQAETEDDFQLWSATFLTVDVPLPPPKLAVWLDLHARRSDATSVGIVRPGVGLHLAPFASAWVGYAWIPTARDDADTVVHEHRAWQQVIFQHKLDAGVSIQSRLRAEQRFSEAGDDVALRYRQFMRVGWQPSAEVPLGLAVWDEIFFGLLDADWGPARGFDQNRFFAGPFWQAAGFARVEVGYLSHYVERGEPDLLGHTLAMNLFFAFKP